MSSPVSISITIRKLLKRTRSDDENGEDDKNGHRISSPRKLCKHAKHNREKSRTTFNCSPRLHEKNVLAVSRRRLSTPGRPRFSKGSKKEMNPWVADFLNDSIDDSNTASDSSFVDIHINTRQGRRTSCGSIRDDSCGPLLGSYQMLGDSLFVRFAEQILQEQAVIGENGKFSNGNCVSGQTIEELIMKIRLSRLLEPNVIVLIGTNNFLKRSSMDEMMSCMQRLVSILCFRSQNIILLTVPPIPRLMHNHGYWEQWEAYNKWLMTLDDGSAVKVIDIGNLFLLRSRTPDMAAYERYMGHGKRRRMDHIHLNKEGLLRLKREIFKLVDMQSDFSDWEDEGSFVKIDL